MNLNARVNAHGRFNMQTSDPVTGLIKHASGWIDNATIPDLYKKNFLGLENTKLEIGISTSSGFGVNACVTPVQDVTFDPSKFVRTLVKGTDRFTLRFTGQVKLTLRETNFLSEVGVVGFNRVVLPVGKRFWAFAGEVVTVDVQIDLDHMFSATQSIAVKEVNGTTVSSSKLQLNAIPLISDKAQMWSDLFSPRVISLCNIPTDNVNTVTNRFIDEGIAYYVDGSVTLKGDHFEIIFPLENMAVNNKKRLYLRISTTVIVLLEAISTVQGRTYEDYIVKLTYGGV